MAATGRWGLRYPTLADAADVPLWMQRLATDLDNVAMDDQGTLGARPVSSAASPGKRGRYYFGTDTKTLYRDNGTGWDAVTSTTTYNTRTNRPAPSASLAGTFFYASDQAALYLCDGANWIRMGANAGDIAYTIGLAPATGWIAGDGSQLDKTLAVYTELHARIQSDGYRYGSTSTLFGIPDLRGRAIVSVGTHPFVNAVGNTDGIATVAQRTPRHRHTVTDPGHHHTEVKPAYGFGSSGTWTTSAGDAKDASANTSDSTTGISVGAAGATSEPLDTPAFMALIGMIKL